MNPVALLLYEFVLGNSPLSVISYFVDPFVDCLSTCRHYDPRIASSESDSMASDKRSCDMGADGYTSFLVRCWREQAEGEQHELWRGEVEQIQSGERHCFQTLAELLAFLLDATVPSAPNPQVSQLPKSEDDGPVE